MTKGQAFEIIAKFREDLFDMIDVMEYLSEEDISKDYPFDRCFVEKVYQVDTWIEDLTGVLLRK